MSDDVDPKKAAELSLKITSAAAKAYERILEEENERIEKLLSDINTYYAECIAEREDLKQEVAELKRAVKTAVFADSVELKDVKKEGARLRAEIEKLRAALKPFADKATEIEVIYVNCLPPESHLAMGIEYRNLRAAKAALETE